MKDIFTFLSASLLAVAPLVSFSQKNIDPKEIKDKMEWFADAKLGIFIHAGIYAVDGVDESWSFHNRKIGYADYMKQLKGFTLKHYNPAQWADLIQESGARYAVITTKHHDGVGDYLVPGKIPFKTVRLPLLLLLVIRPATVPNFIIQENYLYGISSYFGSPGFSTFAGDLATWPLMITFSRWKFLT